MFRLITDGSCDLGKDIPKKHDIDVVPFYVSFDGNTYKKEIEEVNIRRFYEKMVKEQGVYPKTSMPSIDDYLRVFRPCAKRGEAILCLCITSKFSGSYNSASNARRILLEEFPDATIYVIDTQVNTVLQGILVLETIRMRDAGWSLTDTVRRVNEIKKTGRILFTVGSMDYLVHGGRAGKLTGTIANTFGLKPLIVLEEGEIHLGGVSRGRKKSLKQTISMISKHFAEIKTDPNEYSIVVGYGYDYEEAVEFAKDVQESLHLKKPLELLQIGATIAVHTGPYPLGVGLIKKAF